MNKPADKVIVLVDDDPGVLFLHELILVESGFAGEVSTFHGAREALNFLDKNESGLTPVIIFLDINMPRMSGWEMLEEMQSGSPAATVHVVMVTSSINSADKEKAKKFDQVIAFLEKPLTLQACDELKSHAVLKQFF